LESTSSFLHGTMLIEVTLAAIALLGHAVIWVGVNNRLHAMRIKRSHLKTISALSHVGLVAVPLVFGWWIDREQRSPGQWHMALEEHPAAFFYILLCIGMATVHVPRWLYVRCFALRKAGKRGRRLFVLDVANRLGRHPVHGLQFAVGRHVPLNHVMQVEFSEKEIPIAELPNSLDGLRIAHLSDVHLSGRVEPVFFQEVFREVNALNPDLILLTGDICDKASCVPWIAEVLGPLRARYGKYSILGNHDRRLRNIAQLRAAIRATGFVDLGGRWSDLAIGSASILLAGNERPWFGPAPDDEEGAALSNSNNAPAIKILLSHSPDQVRWARRRGFQLMLCGHTHGGQVQFPLVGPVVCPSWYGVRYAGGLFLENSMAIHVSRGISGLFPIRWCCYPEIALLVLKQLPPSQDR
jgi:predicted MPP superfamily phosphohydrolase